MASRHRPVSPRTRSSFASRLLMPIAIAGLLLVGLAVFTVVNGELRLPFGGGVLFAFEKDQAVQDGKRIPAGSVGVFACPRPLPAFTRITQDHLYSANGVLHIVAVVPEAVEPNKLYRADNEGLKRLIGRVLRRSKPINYAFKESDFLPVGTRPGPSAGIPPGKRGMWINTSTVHGLSDVHAGDRVDLVAAVPMQTPSALDPNVLGNLTDPVIKSRLATASQGASEPQASSWVVARSALVVAPKRMRALGGNARRGQGKEVGEVFLAMTPEEVTKFSQALAQEVTMVAAPRSNRPEPASAEIADSRPVNANDKLRQMLTGDDEEEPTFGMVEVIRGGERHTVTVPRVPKEKENDKR